MSDWKNDRIKIIKEVLPMLGKNFVLKGGTALDIYYNLDRYSEDIDLDIISGSMNIVSKLKNPGYEIWDVSIKKDTDTVFRVMINYGSKNTRGDYPLKIEISSRNKNLLKKGFFDYENTNGVNVYSLEEILKMKIIAFNDRDKIRDFYDLSFYLHESPEEFSVDMLYSFKEKMDYKNFDSLALLLEDEFKFNELKEIDGDKIVLETYDKIEKLLMKKIQKHER